MQCRYQYRASHGLQWTDWFDSIFDGKSTTINKLKVEYMDEIWKDIKGYEGLYQVSNLGNIKSLNYNHTGNECILRLRKNNCGYFNVILYKNNKTKSHKVHRLVAEAFIPNPDNLPCVNHKSEIKTQNYVWVNEDGTIDPEKSNLEWCDRSYNVNYGTHNERMLKTRNKRGGKTAERLIAQITLDGQIIKIWPSIMEAERNGFHRGCICLCCQGKLHKHKGFKWQYT